MATSTYCTYISSTIVTYVHHCILFGKFRLDSDLPDIVFTFLRTEIETTGRKPSYRRLFTYQRKRKPSFKSFLYGNHFSNIVCCLLACSRFTRFLRVRRATQRAHLRIRNANRMNDDQITFAEICPLFRFPRAAAAIQQSESDCKMGSKPF